MDERIRLILEMAGEAGVKQVAADGDIQRLSRPRSKIPRAVFKRATHKQVRAKKRPRG